MEHRICHLKNNKELKKWYKYQSIGIVTGMYDALALVLGNADFDGDTVCTFDNQQFIDAVQREFKAGNGRLVIKKELDKKDIKQADTICISDRAALMKVNQTSFKNSIGSVIDRETDLWSCVHVGNEEDKRKIRDYIMTGVIVGSETIDFAKTGEKASFPKEIKDFFKHCKRGHWMRYLPKNRAEAIKEENAIKKALNSGKSEYEIEKLRKFVDHNSNMDRLCRYAEKQVADIDDNYLLKASDNVYKFNYRKCLLRSIPSINRKVYRMVQVLQREYQEISEKYRKESLKSKTNQRVAADKYRWFYDKCRTELLILEPNIDVLIDMLVIIFYGDKKNGAEFLELEKDILWNAFPEEMIARCSERDITTKINFTKLEENHKKNVAYIKAQRKKNENRKKVTITSIEKDSKYKNSYVLITKEDRKVINKLIDKAYDDKLIERKDNVVKLKRVLTMLIYLNRKCVDENGNLQWIKKLNNVPNEITDLTLEKLTAVNHKYMDIAIAIFEKLGAVKSTIFRGGTKIKLLFPYNKGEEWIFTDDYNKAGTMIRDYFRDEKSKITLGLQNEFRENSTKIS